MSRDEHNRRKESPHWELVSVQFGSLRASNSGAEADIGTEGRACLRGGRVVLGTREHAHRGGIRPGRFARDTWRAPGRHAFVYRASSSQRGGVFELLAALPGLSRGFPPGDQHRGRPGADKRVACS